MDQLDAKRYSENWGLEEAIRMQRKALYAQPLGGLELRAHRGGAKETRNMEVFQKVYGCSVIREVVNE